MRSGYSSSMQRLGALRTLAVGTSVLAIACAQPGWAQVTTSPQQTPTPTNESESGVRPSGDGTGGTFSGSGDVQAGSTPPVSNSAGGNAGVAGTEQDPAAAPDNERDEIVITGIRQSLANAQQIKRSADTVVDALTAEDIGALPDRTVNEALQRVPGVVISRFAAPNDSQHFSAQGAGVVIRGLSYVRGEFNGRDAFAAGGGREIGFNDIPSEIVGSIEVFKNLTADLIEGGISGTVNINTRKPFDSDQNLLFLSAGGNIGDMELRAAPQAVGLVSRQWDVGGGRFGILGSVTYRRERSRADSEFIASPILRFNDDRNRNGVQDPGEGRVINAGTGFSNPVFDTFPVPAGFQSVYVPLGAGQRTQTFDRERVGYSASAQYQNADRNFLATVQFLRAESKEEWLERTHETNNYYNDLTQVFPAPGSSFTYDDNGIFESGVLAQPNNGGAQGFRPDGSYGVLQFDPNGIRNDFSNRHFYSKSITQDQSLNIKWEPTDRLRLNLDGQYVTSKVKTFDDILNVNSFSQIAVSTAGKQPDIIFVAPAGTTTQAYFANPDNLFFRNAFNGIQDNNGREYALRGDAQYDFGDESFLRSVRVGGRYADRKQTVRAVDYTNWGAVSETWTGTGPVTFADVNPAYGQLYNWDDFYRNQVAQPPSSFFVPDAILSDHGAFTEMLRNIVDITNSSNNTPASYTPAEDRGGGRDANGKTLQNPDLIRTYFQPNEIYPNREKTYALYGRADFGYDFDGDVKLTGNVGLRFVRTKNSASGGITFPQSTQVYPGPTRNEAGVLLYDSIPSYCAYTLGRNQETGSTTPLPAICTVSPVQQQSALAFANGSSVDDVARQKFNFWLPSLNMRLDITPKLLMRFAASKAISRPNFGDLRDFTGLNASGGNTTGFFGFQGTARNPFLRPIEAKQADLTAEWYFAKVGQLTGAVFYKNLSNIIVDNFGYGRTFTNNGATYDVQVNGPANVPGSAKIKGAEISYQQTYDFLPGPLRGLGMQATYTYVDAGRIPNPIPANASNDGNRPTQDITGLYDNLPLQGLSKHNYNLAGFYDLGAFYARVAYSWRSKFLLTNRDCCFPFLPVYALANGQLDASAFVTVNKNFKLGITGSNLLDTTTKTTFLLNGDGLEAKRSFFKNDRIYTLTARLTY